MIPLLEPYMLAAVRRRQRLVAAGMVLFSILGVLALGPGTRLALFATYTLFFLLLAAIDLEHRIVPNRLVLPALAVAPVASLLWGHSVASVLLGGAIHLGFFVLSAVLMRGGIGMGDIKLALLLGMLTGYPGVIASLLASSLLSGVTSVLLVILRRRGLKDFIPFAPFMLGGAIVALLWPLPPAT